MTLFWTILINILLGFLSGILGGMGMGGGTLLIPLLSIFLGYEQKLCQGINLVAFVVMALFSLIIHFRSGFIETRGIFYIIISGIIFSILGALIAGYVPSSILRTIFGGFLCILSLWTFYKAIKS